MSGRVALRLEDAAGRPVAPGVQWESTDRRFLWEVVHDTRGVLRAGIPAADAALIRQVQDPHKESTPETNLDPARALAAYEAAEAAMQALGGDGPTFWWVALKDGPWSAVVHFESGGQPRSLVGGWAAPLLRGGPDGEEPIHTIRQEGPLEVEGTALRIRRESFYECFREDLERLKQALRAAQTAGHRVRFMQT